MQCYVLAELQLPYEQHGCILTFTDFLRIIPVREVNKLGPLY